MRDRNDDCSFADATGTRDGDELVLDLSGRVVREDIGELEVLVDEARPLELAKRHSDVSRKAE
jgi:hypothetical protein